MIISFSGDAGSGKSTIAKKISKEIKFPRYYIGQLLRNLAKKKGMTLVEYLKLGEKDSLVDKKVDDYVKKLAYEKDNFIIESRTACFLIPNSFKIFLTVDPLDGAKRIFNDLQGENNRNEDREINNLEDVIRSNYLRKETDKKRYLKYYNFDFTNLANYDFVLDTTRLSINEVYKKVLDKIYKKLKSKEL